MGKGDINLNVVVKQKQPVTLLPFATVYAFVAMFIWPAIKTLAGVRAGKYRGRWCFYWMGLPYIFILYFPLNFFLHENETWPWALIAVSSLLSMDTGLVTRKFAEKVVQKVYKRYYNEIKALPDFFSDKVGEVIRAPFNMATTMITGVPQREETVNQ